MREPDVPELGGQNLDVVLRFLPVFGGPGYVFGAWHSPEGQFPYYSMSRETTDFWKTLHEQQIVFAFDWTSWQDEAEKLVSDRVPQGGRPTRVKKAAYHPPPQGSLC